jgi:hypothetical protein
MLLFFWNCGTQNVVLALSPTGLVNPCRRLCNFCVIQLACGDHIQRLSTRVASSNYAAPVKKTEDIYEKSESFRKYFRSDFPIFACFRISRIYCSLHASSIINYPRRLSHCCLDATYLINSEFLDFKLKDLFWLQEPSYHIRQKEKFFLLPSPAFFDFHRKYDDSCNQIKYF